MAEVGLFKAGNTSTCKGEKDNRSQTHRTNTETTAKVSVASLASAFIHRDLSVG